MIMWQSFFDICVHRVCNMYVCVVCIVYECFMSVFSISLSCYLLSVFYLFSFCQAKRELNDPENAIIGAFAGIQLLTLQFPFSCIWSQIWLICLLTFSFHFDILCILLCLFIYLFFAFGDEQPWLHSWKNVVLSLLSWTETTSFCVILGHL